MSDVVDNLRNQLSLASGRYADRVKASPALPATGFVVGKTGELYRVKASNGMFYNCRSISTGAIEIDPNGQGKPVALNITDQGVPTIGVMPT